ncbi:carbohydrate ABC transporter permease [Aureimonas leprariae]|uniref:Sugar ABC transporter permease n=1 Tax=Plantimonas leprariae TaxID=2615207 RepID=A0A7V7TYG2_9HYPH|nr:sugar ABC transporter permease [Aureimonas leprariae]KAB0682952.1 sugar ABC transporter permease [Aureimonas leprariae]
MSQAGVLAPARRIGAGGVRLRTLQPWLLLLPAFVALAAVTLYPILNGIRLSFTNTSLITLEEDYVGVANYRELWADPQFWNAWTHTLWFTFASTALETLIGLGMALILFESFAGRGIVRAAMLVPWAMPTVVTSKMFGWLFDGQHGIVNWLLLQAGILDARVNWYGSPDTALATIVIADVWKTTPFMALLLLAGLQTIPRSLTEAAEMDGARAWSIFWHVRLPLLMPTLLIAGLFRALDAFRIFDLVYVLTGGGPADSTETLSTLAYKVLFSTLSFGAGSAISTAMFVTEGLIALVFCLFLVRQIRRAGT